VFDIKGVALDHRGSVEGALTLLQRDPSKISVVVLEGREAPASLRNEELDVLLTTLNIDFRSDSGRKTLFVIPTTSSSLAQSISKQAALIGGMTTRDRPFFVFDGPSRNQYIPITNETLMAFNEAKILIDYGIPDDLTRGIAEASASIGEFIENCHHEITSRQSLLTKNAAEVRHKRIHLWMIFCSFEEDLRRNHDIVRSLTVGDKQRVQVSRMLAGDSKEIREWQTRPAEFAQAASYLDLRILYLPMRTALAVITAYAPSEMLHDLKKQKLLQRETVRERAKESLNNTALGAFLRQQGFSDDPSRRGRLEPRQKAQFLEIMKIAVNDETVLNSMIADALRELNTDPETAIVTEKELTEQRTLLSDIVIITPTDIYCLEMKWRSSMLQGSEVMRESVARVRDFVKNLPELKHLFP
jgi:hypothetical protein